MIGDEQVISLQRTKVYVFSDSVLCLGKIHENPNQTLHGNTDGNGSKVHRNTEPWTELIVSQWKVERNIFPRFNTLQLSQEVQELLFRLYETPEIFQEG